MKSLIWYCRRCRKLVRSEPPMPRACRCEKPVVMLRPTTVYSA